MAIRSSINRLALITLTCFAQNALSGGNPSDTPLETRANEGEPSELVEKLSPVVKPPFRKEPSANSQPTDTTPSTTSEEAIQTHQRVGHEQLQNAEKETSSPVVEATGPDQQTHSKKKHNQQQLTLEEITTADENESDKKRTPHNGCKRETEGEMWVDAVRADTHSRLCNTASWLDGLFGDSEEFLGEDFRGKVSVGFKHDEIEGIDPRLRVRIRTKLPNVSKRFDAFVGRVEEDSYISNTEVNEDRLSNVGLRSTNDEDSEWLVGLGYRRPREDSNGWDLSVGAKLSSGISPYAKVAHRYLFPTSDVSFWRTTQTIFWRKQDGYGVSSRADYTRLISDDDIWITQGSFKYTEEAEQWEWFGETTWHHSITEKRGVSSSLYLRGEEQNPVSLPEYGLTFTYIRPILRDWLYLETGVDFRWERFEINGPYKSAVRFGIQFDMLLGDYYQGRRRHK